MNLSKSKWNPEKSWFDELFSLFLQSNEKIVASGKGAHKKSRNGQEFTGKVYVTNLRTAVIPNNGSEGAILNLPWGQVKIVESKNHFFYSTALFQSGDGSLVSIASTRSVIKSLKEMSDQKIQHIYEMEDSDLAFFEKEITSRCQTCMSLAIPPLTQCQDCLRNLVWPEALKSVIKLASKHSEFVPDFLSNGESSRGDLVTKDVAILTTACYCLGELDYVKEAEKWAESIMNGQLIEPSEFMDFPVLKRFGPHAENERLWNDARKLPAKLHGL